MNCEHNETTFKEAQGQFWQECIDCGKIIINAEKHEEN